MRRPGLNLELVSKMTGEMMSQGSDCCAAGCELSVGITYPV